MGESNWSDFGIMLDLIILIEVGTKLELVRRIMLLLWPLYARWSVMIDIIRLFLVCSLLLGRIAKPPNQVVRPSH